jgi:hypothetical protein
VKAEERRPTTDAPGDAPTKADGPIVSDQPTSYVWDDRWDGWEQQAPPDSDEETSSLTEAERAEADPAELWKARPVLAHIHEYARARRVGPWAVLGTVLARVVTNTTPNVQLPATVGGNASLNLFVGLVGPSGMGKDAAQKVGREALGMEHEDFVTNPLGSGEGLPKMFVRAVRPTKEEPNPAPEQYNRAALVTIGEIDTFTALSSRQGATLTGQLRQAAMGEQLGFFWSDETKRIMVPEHSYRLCLIAGIQPTRSGGLLNDGDGGTPQRFIWLPAGDPDAPDVAPPEPRPWLWVPPEWTAVKREFGEPCWEVDLPAIVRQTVDAARLRRLRLEGDALDSHALLTRTKVAAALAILEGRTAVEEEDWRLSGVVMAMSDQQRELCQRTLKDEAAKVNRGQAVAEAERAIVVTKRVDEDRVKRVSRKVKTKLSELGPMTASVLRRSFGSQDRDALEDALDHLTRTGDVVAIAVEHRGGTGLSYRLNDHR